MEEKNNKGLIWLIIILIVLVLGLIGYIIYDKTSLSNNKIENNTTTTTTTKKVVDNSKYDEVISFNITLNDVEHEIAYKFNALEGKENHKDLTDEEINDAKKNGVYVYRSVNLNIFIDEIFVKTIPIFFDIEGNSEYYEVKNLINNFDKNSLKILKGTDNKDYLVFLIQEEHPFLDGKTNPIIVNEIGKILYEFDYELGGGQWIEDTRSKLYFGENYDDEREYLIDKDKIYFINTSDSCPEAKESEYGYIFYFQENILTINNNKVNIETGNCYKGNGAGIE